MNGYLLGAMFVSSMALALPMGCASSSSSSVCTPNGTQVCECAGGETGVQTCNDNGSAYSECACGEDAGTDDSGNGHSVCTPNGTQECDCAGGGTGVQTCNADGTAYSACASCEAAAGEEAGVCVGFGLPCTSDHDCCQTGQDTRYGAACVDPSGGTNYVCVASCTSDSECTSGCCAPISGEAGSVCSVATDCGGSVCSNPVTTTTSCAAGAVPCDSSHCCPESTPYGCISDLSCYATEAEAEADCGSTCLVCGG